MLLKSVRRRRSQYHCERACWQGIVDATDAISIGPVLSVVCKRSNRRTSISRLHIILLIMANKGMLKAICKLVSSNVMWCHYFDHCFLVFRYGSIVLSAPSNNGITPVQIMKIIRFKKQTSFTRIPCPLSNIIMIVFGTNIYVSYCYGQVE